MRFWKPRKIAGTPRVGIAVAAYLNAVRDCHALTGLVAALGAQTYTNWYAVVVHDGLVDGVEPTATLKRLRTDNSANVEVWETAERKGQFGHPHRQLAIERLLDVGCEWIGLTNQDNYYAPVYLEYMVSEAQRQKAPFVYCDMVRSHLQWKPFTTRPKKGYLDLGGFLAHKSIVEKIKFDKFTFTGDGDYINRLVQAAKGMTAKAAATLFVHN